MRIKIRGHLLLLILVLVLSLGTYAANASMFASVDFGTLVHGSEFIFEGRVISKEVRPHPVNGSPFTYFMFEIIDIVKGTYPDATIEIGFMGGTLDNKRLQISDMKMPEIGERGIYFVETLSEQQIHPLLGWQQGHYLVVPNRQTGKNMVRPVEQERLGKGLSRSIRSVTVEEFKGTIRNTLGREQ